MKLTEAQLAVGDDAKMSHALHLVVSGLMLLAGCDRILVYRPAPFSRDARADVKPADGGDDRDAMASDGKQQGDLAKAADGRGGADVSGADTWGADGSADGDDDGGLDSTVAHDGSSDGGCQGCIDEGGNCQPGSAMDACGTGGEPCVSCDPMLEVCEGVGCTTE